MSTIINISHILPIYLYADHVPKSFVKVSDQADRPVTIPVLWVFLLFFLFRIARVQGGFLPL